ncbi:unnamed protein product [Durusdinium trenchii]|uniref:Uncharacterized protein n=1 Tax=Durusdinium trenchii TaxID=1381693 RepID=A0ABP0SHN7_9DINO
MEPVLDMAEGLTDVKEEEPLLEDGTLIAEAPAVEEHRSADDGEDEGQQMVAAGTIIAQETADESEAPEAEDFLNVKEETQADGDNADYQEEDQESKEEDLPIVGTIIAEGNAEEDGDAEAASTSRLAVEQDSVHEGVREKRRRSPEPFGEDEQKAKRLREKEWEKVESHGSTHYGNWKNKLELQQSWLKDPEEVKKRLEQEEKWRNTTVDGFFDYVELNFSKTKLTSSGLREVVKFCKQCPDLRVLKLFQNDIDDEGCFELAGIFKECTLLEELHLSHNWITEKGVAVLAEAALEDLSTRFSRPLWLRVEHNYLSNASGFMERLKTKYYPHICGRDDRRDCSNKSCINNCRIHIPFLIEERGGKGGARWGRSSWDNNHNDNWPQYSQTSQASQYKARQPSRSRSPQHCRIRLKERSFSPTKPNPRWERAEPRAERMPERREVYYDVEKYRRPKAPPRAPTPPPRPHREQPVRRNPPIPPSRHRSPPRRNRQVPAETRQPQKPPVRQFRRPPSPPKPKPKAQQVTYAVPAPLPPQAAADSDYSYYYSEYSYDEDEPQPPQPACAMPVARPQPVTVPMAPVRQPQPVQAPPRPARPRVPPKAPPRETPRAPQGRARTVNRREARQLQAEQHLVERYEALSRNDARPRPAKRTR